MKVEVLVADVTYVDSPAREREMLGIFLEPFLANSGHFCGWGATLLCGNHLLSPNTFS